jgi:GDPmannose 4,6-dehydratase
MIDSQVSFCITTCTETTLFASWMLSTSYYGEERAVPRALITGIGGQDGGYLAELLREKNYEVYGLVHEGHSGETRITARLPFVNVVFGNLIDASSLVRVYQEVEPDEIYNLGSLSAVDQSFKTPLATLQVTGAGVLNALEAFRLSDRVRRGAKFYQASSAEMFGNAGPGPYSETTPFNPQSPYAAAKVLGHNLVKIYRDAYNVFAATGICFNHESPRRGTHFVSRKISMGVARINKGLQSRVVLGNLNSRRDWGFAGDYVRAMWLSLQQPAPDDYVIATGESHSVSDFAELAFAHIGVANWRDYVDQSDKHIRPLDVTDLYGDSTKARKVLGWEPTVEFQELVGMMVDAEMARIAGLGSPND